VSSFIEIPRLSTEISRHAKQVLTDGQRTDGRPESIMPLAVYCRQRRHKYYTCVWSWN